MAWMWLFWTQIGWVSDVAQIKKCNIGPGFIKFIPTGIKVTLKDGKKHVFSVTKREKMMQALGGN